MKKLFSKSTKVVPYDHAKIEKKWQKKWESSKIYRAKDKSDAKKFYGLIEFPYPSGEGLHVGHIRSNTAMDIIARKRRREGFNVLYPIGWDAFGLPTENYAIKTGIQPSVVTKKNADTFRRQLRELGFSFDWSREINTTDPKYYKWTQWIFLQFLKKGLAYKKKMTINWCPKDLIGLANEEVINGKCERCGTDVEKKEKEQWMLAITKYAERLLGDLDAMDTCDMPHIIDKKWPPREGKTVVERRTVHALVRDPKTGKFLGLKWKKYPWITFIVGGVEDGEDIVKAAAREVEEETGYKDLKFIQTLGGPVKAEYFAAHKDQNRVAITSGILFELAGEAQNEVSEHEKEKHDNFWMEPKDMNAEVMTCAELPVWLERLSAPEKYNEPTDIQPLLDWPEHIKEAQRNWIGKSEGAEIKFKIQISSLKKESTTEQMIEVFTTRPDTLFGVTYVTLAPEHPLVREFISSVENKDEVEAYIAKAKTETDIQRTDATKEKTGVELKGIKVINPANNEEVPVWIADYVLPDYGTGAVMAVPAHDERDWEFAKKFNLPIRQVIEVPSFTDSWNEHNAILGKLINSGEFTGKDSTSVMKDITKFVAGEWVVKYKLRDWVFSRQRYWGEPIPVVHCPHCAENNPAGQGIVAVPEKDLPVKLPPVKNYQPTQTGESPLASITKWVNTKCPVCKGPAKRETDTMPNWAGSSWYYLRYTDSKNKKVFADYNKLKYWTPVDWYNGGMEHVTLHLLYSRFWHKFMFDIGLVPTPEPYKKRTSHGLILAGDGNKMSKSRGNVINPDTLVKSVGADSLRVYEMFMGPFDQSIAWNTDNIAGVRRFIERVWKLKNKITTEQAGQASIDRIIHKTIKKVSDDIETMRFNTAISSLMIAVNEIESAEIVSKTQYETLLQLLAPFAPHVSDELWSSLGNKKSIHTSAWPSYNAVLAIDDEIKIMVQVNGKVRGSFMVKRGTDKGQLENLAKNIDEIKKWLTDKTIDKVVVVPDRLVSIVTIS